MRISDGSSDVCSSDLEHGPRGDRGLRVGGKGFPERQGGKRCQKPVIVDAVHEDVDELLDVANNAMPGLDRAHCFKRGKRSQDAASMRGDLLAYEVNGLVAPDHTLMRSEEHTSELQSLMRISYAVFCLKQKKNHNRATKTRT